MDELGRHLAQWSAAGVIDEETAARIRAFERERAGPPGLRWPILVALAFGALMLASGVLLFVAAHWDTLSPRARFALVLLLVAIFHVGGALVAERFRGMAAALHAVGTVALGAGIFLAGQIFSLDEHWPGGVMLWALGAVAGWALLRQLPQLALAAVLVPAWLASEWLVATAHRAAWAGAGVLACGLFTLALAYFTAPDARHADRLRSVLLWVGGVALVPASIYLAIMSADIGWGANLPSPSTRLIALGWTVAMAGPLAVAAWLHGRAAWPNAVAASWAAAVFALDARGGHVLLYVWWALGAMALIAWGVRESRRERINMGAALFAATVIAFYFSEVMDKLGRSASLIGLGVLFLAGGWALERVRRRLVLQTKASS